MISDDIAFVFIRKTEPGAQFMIVDEMLNYNTV